MHKLNTTYSNNCPPKKKASVNHGYKERKKKKEKEREEGKGERRKKKKGRRTRMRDIIVYETDVLISL